MAARDQRSIVISVAHGRHPNDLPCVIRGRRFTRAAAPTFALGSAPTKASLMMGKKPVPPPLDLFEVRRRLIDLRSQHSSNRRVAAAINRLISKLAHLNEPEDQQHDEQLRSAISKTFETVERIVSGKL